MIVYKFGGASVNSADGVRNLGRIVSTSPDRLFVVVSAMGKTTNALEAVLERTLEGDTQAALALFGDIESGHRAITGELLGGEAVSAAAESLYAQARELIAGGSLSPADYDRSYDALVSFGELISTAIISDYLGKAGIPNLWVDMRRCLVTAGHHRSADVLSEESARRLAAATADPSQGLFIGQGFIGAMAGGEPSTLGREGSDYSAAVVANLLDATHVTIWKDVPGIPNADPRIFPDAVHIPELTYLDAVELAYSGAQVIHPKTIKPLQNKHIPLYVRPFADPSAPGSVIKGSMEGTIDSPVLIVKHRQVLVSIRPRDFSFVLEDRLLDILHIFEENSVKVNLIQTSAVNLSLCVDECRTLQKALDMLARDFRTVYNDGMELLTIRGYTPELYSQHTGGGEVYLTQSTRRIVRIVRKAKK